MKKFTNKDVQVNNYIGCRVKYRAYKRNIGNNKISYVLPNGAIGSHIQYNAGGFIEGEGVVTDIVMDKYGRFKAKVSDGQQVYVNECVFFSNQN